MKRNGRPPVAYDQDKADVVRLLAKYGVPVRYIAAEIGYSQETLRKVYGVEYEEGRAKAVIEASKLLWTKAMEGNVTCLIFWMKSHGFCEKQQIDLSNEDGSLSSQPLSVNVQYIDPTKEEDISVLPLP